MKTVIPNILLNEDVEEIDINELRGDGETASTVLNLYLENSFNQPSPIVLSEDEIFSTIGTVNYHYDLVITAIGVDGQSQSEFGIILKERGNYFLGSAYLQNPLSFYLEASNYNQISINTNFSNQDSDRFRFSVE